MIFFFWSQSMSHSHDHLPTYEGGVGKLDPLALNHKGFLFFKNCAIFSLFSFIFVFSNKQYNSYNKYMWKCCVHPVYNRGNWDLPTGQRNQPAEPRWTVFLYTSSCQMEFYLNQAFTALPPPQWVSWASKTETIQLWALKCCEEKLQHFEFQLQSF